MHAVTEYQMHTSSGNHVETMVDTAKMCIENEIPDSKFPAIIDHMVRPKLDCV